tara:strand:+ start:158 stop:430 length:273 start_codon:yes stop_codon:yes gene_type:complete
MIKLTDLLKEQPNPPKKTPPQQPQGGEETEKELKIDIPDSPFEPDASQITTKLKDMLKQWETTPYMSDKHRWQEYYKDVAKLVKTIVGDE